MLKKLIKGLVFVVGCLIGYLIFRLLFYIIIRVGLVTAENVAPAVQYGVMILFALIFGFILLKSAPALRSQAIRVGDAISKELQGVAPGKLISGTIGLIVGLVIAFLISQMLTVIVNNVVRSVVVTAVYLLLCFLGVVVGVSKGPEIGDTITSGKLIQDKPDRAKSIKLRKKGSTPKILDTSVIIDGRIADILKTGFLEGPIVIPDFVLVELRHIADSSDSLKRARGRQGLDILNQVRTEYGVEIYNTDSEKALRNIPEVDVKLLKLAEITQGKVVTNDYNLNKVAGINGVSVLNINELANCMKPVMLPGEEMSVSLIKEGKDREQAVAYLNDGTMVVVEDGRSRIGSTCEIVVTSVLQTAAGRMIFGRLKQ